MQCVIRTGEEFVFATHDDALELAGVYLARQVVGAAGKAAVAIPAGEVVRVPYGFVFAYDAEGRMKDPRRFAGKGGKALGSSA